jgi:hypothetical protein
MGDEINSSPKFFRRKRRHQGATWTPERTSAAPEDGAWCVACRQRHGYKSRGLLMNVEKTVPGGHWRLLWTCRKTGNVLEVMDLSKVYVRSDDV